MKLKNGMYWFALLINWYLIFYNFPKLKSRIFGTVTTPYIKSQKSNDNSIIRIKLNVLNIFLSKSDSWFKKKSIKNAEILSISFVLVRSKGILKLLFSDLKSIISKKIISMVDMRNSGQGHEISVTIPNNILSENSIEIIEQNVIKEYEFR